MSNKKVNQVKKLKVGDSVAKGILLYLADAYNETTNQCNPSQDTIAEDLEINRSTVHRKLKFLEENGFIKPLETLRFQATNYILSCCTLQHDTFNTTPRNVADVNTNKITHRVALVNTTEATQTSTKESTHIEPHTNARVRDESDTTENESNETTLPTENADKNFLSRVPNIFEMNKLENDERFAAFRDAVDEGLSSRMNITTLPAHVDTLKNLEWLFINKFTVTEILECYDEKHKERTIFCQCVPKGEQCSTHWRKSKITSKILVEEIADWKLQRGVTTNDEATPKPKQNFDACPDCKGKGYIDIDRMNVRICQHPHLQALAKKIEELVA